MTVRDIMNYQESLFAKWGTKLLRIVTQGELFTTKYIPGLKEIIHWWRRSFIPLRHSKNNKMPWKKAILSKAQHIHRTNTSLHFLHFTASYLSKANRLKLIFQDWLLNICASRIFGGSNYNLEAQKLVLSPRERGPHRW